MKKEFLLLGGSHMAQVVTYVKSIGSDMAGINKDIVLKCLTCSDLDMSATLTVTKEGHIDCRGHAYLAKACLAAYNSYIIPPHDNRVICLLLGSWHHAVDDPFWGTRYPADLPPRLKQRFAVSANEIIERLWPEIFIRIKVAESLLKAGHKFFLCFTPFVPFYQAANLEIPVPTIRYIHGLCHTLYKNSLKALGVKYMEYPRSFIGPDGFLKPELSLYNNSHGNDRYIAEYWNYIKTFLDTNNWNIYL